MSTKHLIRLMLVLVMLFVAGSVQAQTVKGNVKDDIGEPIMGATVMEEGVAGNGAVTDIDGNFTLTLKGKTKKIKVSYIGMIAQTVSVGSGEVSVQLKSDAQNLNDVVVIGYGTVRKKDLTGSVASIGAKEIEGVPVANIGEAMTGKLAGVNITTTEGSPDADIKIRVRGGGSLSQDNSPLYIVDGFPVSSISDVAPSEIESIDVLKDASSTAIYGARGANGVIIITTKSGHEGKPTITVNGSLAWKKLTKEVKTMDPYNYAYYQYELGSKDYGDYDDLEIWKSKAGNDYQDELFGRTGLQRRYDASISGGNKKVKYNVSFAHNGETSIMRGSGYTKNNVSGKLNYKFNKWLSVDLSAKIAFTGIDGLGSGADMNESNAANSIVANTVRWRPVEPLVSSDEDENNSTANQRSPLQRINATYANKDRQRHDYNIGLNWKPWKHITFRSEFGYRYNYSKDDRIWSADAVTNSRYGYNGMPQLRYGRDNLHGWRNANTVTYDNSKLFGGRDHINVLLGQEWSSYYEKEKYRTFVSYPAEWTIDQTRDQWLQGNELAPELDIPAKDNLSSFFGRINYTLADKYLATVTMRADGSSKFGDGHRWGVFPSAALAWRISEEKWMKPAAGWLSNLKLRLSYGTAGNNRIPSGQLLTNYAITATSGKHSAFSFLDESTGKWVEQVGTQLKHNSSLPNPDLKWETTITRNVGLDYGFFDGRLNGTIDLYWNTTKDLLMKMEIPSGTGYSYQYHNFGKTSNKGVEFTVNAAIVQKKDFNLNFTGNISWNKNKIDELANDNPWQSSSYAGSTFTPYLDYRIAEGGSLGEVWGYKVNGFYTVYDPTTNPDGDLILNEKGKWALRDGVNNTSYNLTGGLYPGGVKFEVDEDGTPLKQKLGNTIPKVTGGFGLNGTWKAFDFNVFFDYSAGNKIVNGTKLANSFYTGSAKNYNLVAAFNVANRYTWIDPTTGDNLGRGISTSIISKYGGADAVMARLNELNAGAQIWNPAAVSTLPAATSWAVESASFLRLNTVTVGYTFKYPWLKKLYVKSLRLYFSAYNVFVITPYDGYDPEVDTSSKKNPMCPGIDYAAYPKSRSFVGGINITF